jgi:hypothetical protein
MLDNRGEAQEGGQTPLGASPAAVWQAQPLSVTQGAPPALSIVMG